MFRRITAAFLLLLCLATIAIAASLDSQIAAEQKKRKDLNRQIEDYHKRIKEMGTQVKGLLGQIDNLQQEEAVAGQELSVLELENKKLQQDIDTLNGVMGKEQAKINDLSGQMRHRIVDMYKYGASEEMNLFVGSENVFEAARAVHLLKLISDHDGSILSQLQARYQNMDLSRKTMDLQRAQLREQSKALQSQREKYKKSIRDTNAFIGNIQKQKALVEQAAREAEEAQKAVGRTIQALTRRKKEQQEAGQKKGGGTDYLAGRGSVFDWPVRGSISSQFGTRVHPVFKTKIKHSGLDIAAPANTPTKAAAGGEVLFVGWMKGYGQVVILDHGRSFTTVYAHLNSTAVREGQVVKAGTVIGRVGKTGTATGYHLHFEVRVNGVVKNPLDYLKR
ncbi:MAG: peptidoglycan DD-metalloendopeptidase family protein [Synergistaceae bacterium]|nr:peptidoglycan DD-metalloendopeptidase family protein [Synergistaceae bacterium]